ncbi:hypothetical protein PWT90_00676 [Aphanocladium album]|nr:hypothetical protein PWT90_00676 [Aphanocladium album]
MKDMLLTAISMAALAVTTTASLSTYQPVRRSPADFDWTTLTPSRSLRFSPCYEEYECARLVVPLDWTLRNDTRTATIAVTRLPASMTCPTTVTHGGTVMINPGGPGDSGVRDMLVNGHYLRDLVSTETTRFDVLSFDPRGMAFSAPAGDCFAGDEAARMLFNAEMAGVDAFATDDDLASKRALLRAYGERCNRKGEDGFVVGAYMGTASVARDVLRLVDELERLRAEGAGEVPEARPRLQYFGTSYGTMLGNTFVSMFPGRVKRMVLDGNVVPEDYMASDWSGNMVDVAQVVDGFYSACFAAQSACALYDAVADRSPADIRAKVDALATRRARARPLPRAAVQPRRRDLADAVAGNYTSLALAARIPTAGLCDADAAAPAKYAWQPEAGTAVRCGDGADVTNTTDDEWRAGLRRAREQAPGWWVDFWMGAQLQCREWPVRARWRFTGPFGSPEADASGERDDRPAAPVLFLTSRADPATPLRSALAAAKSHKGARVVVHNSTGHCATLSAPSECVKDVVGRYMATGTMPDEGTECEPAYGAV